MGVAKRCFDVLNDSKLDTSMVKVVCRQCLKDSCPSVFSCWANNVERTANQRTERMYQCRCVLKDTENSSFPSSLLTVIPSSFFLSLA